MTKPSNCSADQQYALFLDEVLCGLSKDQKSIPSKYFYDEIGSDLFDQITRTAEYYPTRTEEAIMDSSVSEMVEHIGSNALLVELGSGSSNKTRILLRNVRDLAAYVPIDISAEYLEVVANDLRAMFPDLNVRPVAADYTADVDLQTDDLTFRHIVAYFPGSTIGNFRPDEAIVFLRRIRGLIGRDGGLLIGVDLIKDIDVLEAAYNDQDGVTAEFNLNLLDRMNVELGADFERSRFTHRAVFNSSESRIEMHLVSDVAQLVTIADKQFAFDAGEYIYTESSYKYSLELFNDLASEAGFESVQVWTDDRNYFSIHYLEFKN